MRRLTFAWRLWRCRALAYHWPAAWRSAGHHLKHRAIT
jgi:hypothetical protein